MTHTSTQSLEQRRAEYHAYLRSPEWQRKRHAALERAGHRCQICNSAENLDVHHRTYERIFNEDPSDLTVLCRQHHEMYHAGQSKSSGGGGRKKRKKQPKRKRLVDDGKDRQLSSLGRRLQERDPVRGTAIKAQRERYEAQRRARRDARRKEQAKKRSRFLAEALKASDPFRGG